MGCESLQNLSVSRRAKIDGESVFKGTPLFGDTSEAVNLPVDEYQSYLSTLEMDKNALFNMTLHNFFPADLQRFFRAGAIETGNLDVSSEVKWTSRNGSLSGDFGTLLGKESVKVTTVQLSEWFNNRKGYGFFRNLLNGKYEVVLDTQGGQLWEEYIRSNGVLDTQGWQLWEEYIRSNGVN
jgi:hypothetical protein